MLTNVLQEHTNVVLMLNAVTPRDHTTAIVNLDFLEMDDDVKVKVAVMYTRLNIHDSHSGVLQKDQLILGTSFSV